VNPPKHVRSLTAKEKKEIKRLIRHATDSRVLRRAQIIHLSSQGKICQEIASLLGFSVPTVHRVINAFSEEGLASLPDKPRSGRPRKASDHYIQCLKEAVAVSPRDLGYPFASWTAARLREHLARECDVLLNPNYLSQIMNKHGIVYRRPRHIMGHLRDDVEYDEKKEFLRFLKKARSKSAPPSTSSSLMSVRFISTRP
jgi:transposase